MPTRPTRPSPDPSLKGGELGGSQQIQTTRQSQEIQNSLRIQITWKNEIPEIPDNQKNKPPRLKLESYRMLKIREARKKSAIYPKKNVSLHNFLNETKIYNL